VSYRSGFVKRLRESRHLPAITIETADLPDDVLVLLDPQHHLDLASAYGDPEAGDPIQYDEVSKKPAKESCGSRRSEKLRRRLFPSQDPSRTKMTQFDGASASQLIISRGCGVFREPA